MKTFSAPWSGLLKAMSVPITAICLVVVMMGWVRRGPETSAPAILFSYVLPFAVILGAAMLSVRGYAIAPDAILVKRLFWDTRLPREGLESATYSPEAVRGSIRTFGNGGFYSFTGRYWNRELGNYRAFVTDHARIVVLRYEDRTSVVSPGDPEGFVREVRKG